MSHLRSMIKAEKFKLPSVTISAGVLQEGQEGRQFFTGGPTHPGRKMVRGFGSEAICKASVWRLKEEGEVLSFTVQISISVFWRPKFL